MRAWCVLPCPLRTTLGFVWPRLRSPRGHLHVGMGAVHAAFQATSPVLGAEDPFD